MVLYTAGQRIRGSEINSLPQLYRVTTPQICNNSTTLRDVAGLAFAADANAAYLVECFLAYHATTGGDIKFAFAPAGLFVQGDSPVYTGSWWAAQGIDPNAAGARGDFDARIKATLTTSWERAGDNADPVLACPVAFVQIGAAAGTVRLQFAQQNLAVHDTTIRVGSCMRVSRLA